jgi:hypothetical protein
MSRFRKIIASGVIVILIAGHAWDAYFKDTHWPFSNYPMFRNMNTRDPLVRMALYGVTADGQEVRIMGPTAGPMNYRYNGALSRMYGGREPTEESVARTRRALATLLAYFEAARRKGDVHGPPLARLRLYRLTWPFDEWARNRHDPQKEVLLEVTHPEPSGAAAAAAPRAGNGGGA